MSYLKVADNSATLDGIASTYPNGLYEWLRELLDTSKKASLDGGTTTEVINEALFAFKRIFPDEMGEIHQYNWVFALERGMPTVPWASELIRTAWQIQSYLYSKKWSDGKVWSEDWDRVLSLLWTDSLRVALSMRTAVNYAMFRSDYLDLGYWNKKRGEIKLPSFVEDPKRSNYARSYDESALITLSEDTEKPLDLDAVYTFFLTNGYTPDSVIQRMLPDMDTIEVRWEDQMRKYFQCLSRTDNRTVLEKMMSCYKDPETRNKGKKIVYLRLALVDTPAGMIQGGLNGMRWETVTAVFPSVAVTVETAEKLMRAYCRYHKRGMDPASIDAINYLHTTTIRKGKEDRLRILRFDIDLLKEEFHYNTHYAPPARNYLSSMEQANSIIFALTKACELVAKDDMPSIPALTEIEQDEVFWRLMKLTSHMMLWVNFFSVQAVAAKSLLTLLNRYRRVYDQTTMDTLRGKSTLSRNHYEPNISSLFYTGN